MRKLVFIFSVFTILASSCEKANTITDGNELEFFNGYIQFSSSVNDTRATLSENMRGLDFGVIGFKYSETTNWGTAKSTATPGNWFYNKEVVCDKNNGTCSYGTPEKWDKNNYSFFAYSPFNSAGVTLSANDVVNTPMLTYTYPWLGRSSILLYNDPSPSVDLMTAEAIDVNGSGSGTVTLDFKHRLFAFEVLANNYNENTYEYEVDANGDFLLDENGNKIFKLDEDGNRIIAVGGDAGQNITNLTLTLDGLKNSSMTIPLSMQEGEAEPVYSQSSEVGKPKFYLSYESLRIPAFNETIEHEYNGETELCGAGVPTSISKYGSETGSYLFLIPQDGTDAGITGTLEWTELQYFLDKGGEVSNTFNSTITFMPGVLYQIHINFVGDGITIALIEAGSWDTAPDIIHTFE